MPYPHDRYRLEKCMGQDAQTIFEEGHLKTAVANFLTRVKEYNAAPGRGAALMESEKKSILPYLVMLVDAGWPVADAEAVIRCDRHDTKSVSRARNAFVSIGAFALKTGIREADMLHVALHYIGQTLEQALPSKANFNPDEPRDYHGRWTTGGGGDSPAASKPSGGGRFDIGKIPPNPMLQPASARTPQSPKQMRTSKEGAQFIRSHETFKPYTYPDLAKHLTIGYGHRLLPGESFPKGISRAQGEEIFQHDLRTAENVVRHHVTADLTQPQFDALTSFAFNVGGGNFRISAVLSHVNEGNLDAAAEAFSHFGNVRINGKLTRKPGMSNRRYAEENLFRGGTKK